MTQRKAGQDDLTTERHVAKGQKSATIEPDFNFINAEAELQYREALVNEALKLTPGTPLILIVDDNGPVLQMLESALKFEGYTPLLAANGKKALSLFREFLSRIPVVVLDECLPDTSGQELVTQIHRLSPSTKIILTSGHYGDDFSTPLLDKSYAMFLHKPYSVTGLLQIIKEITGGAGEPARRG